jgi:queuosine precursor transporter
MNNDLMSHRDLHSNRPAYQYYDFLLAGFVAVILCVNLIGAGKAAQIELPFVGHVVFGAGILFFPISYAFSNIFTEVYGYAYDRRAVWCGFGALIFAALMSQVVIHLNPAPGDYNKQLQTGLELVFGNTWRIVVGSMTAYWCGSLVNAYVLAKMKIKSAGKHLWLRVIFSTACAELVDSSLFYMMAFYGIWPLAQVIEVAILQYILKTSWEVLAVPLTYRIVAFLKRKEQEDYFDRNTDFNPFRVRV